MCIQYLSVISDIYVIVFYAYYIVYIFYFFHMLLLSAIHGKLWSYRVTLCHFLHHILLAFH